MEAAHPNKNFGKEVYLSTVGGSSSAVESYLRFSVTGLQGTILSAKLRLYVYDGTVNGPAAYATSNNWAENSITWRNRPARTSAAYDDKGAVPDNSWVEFNITPLVQSNGTFSFVLAQPDVDAMRAYSREGTNPPQLVITLNNPQ